MKKYISIIMSVFVLCFTGLAFGEGGNHEGGHSGDHGSYDGNGHGYDHNSHHGNNYNGYHNNNHNDWAYGFYSPGGAVIVQSYPAYYPPVQRCGYVNVFDSWGNYMGQERICY